MAAKTKPKLPGLRTLLNDDPHLAQPLQWLRMEHRHGGRLLDKDECVALAKKLLCRALQAEFTRAEVEAFLKG